MKCNTNLKICNIKVTSGAFEVTCFCHLLSARCVCSFQNKALLKILFLSNNYQKTDNMRMGTEIVNTYIDPRAIN